MIPDPLSNTILGSGRPLLVGAGRIEPAGQGVRLILPSAAAGTYSDAQLDDYASRRRRAFPWRPPLRLTVRARFSPGPDTHSQAIAGTAGFGFWNNPFSPLGGRPALPRAAWFFYASPPSDMALADGIPGHGWKAAVIDAARPGGLAWAPLAPLVVALNQFPAVRRRLWPPVQRALCIHEAALDTGLMTDWQYLSVGVATRPAGIQRG